MPELEEEEECSDHEEYQKQEDELEERSKHDNGLSDSMSQQTSPESLAGEVFAQNARQPHTISKDSANEIEEKSSQINTHPTEKDQSIFSHDQTEDEFSVSQLSEKLAQSAPIQESPAESLTQA